MKPKKIIVNASEAGQRLDVLCAFYVPEVSRNILQRAIRAGEVTLNKTAVKPRTQVKTRDEIEIILSKPVPVAQNLPASAPSIPIVYEDKDVVVIDKPASIEAHAGQQAGRPTVADWFAARYPNAVHVGEPSQEIDTGQTVLRPGIVHRLDKGTSGLMILAKTELAYEHLKSQFQTRKVKKEYLALVFGQPGEKEGRIVQPLMRSKRNPLRRSVDINGKKAVTEWRKEKFVGRRHTLLRIFPETGRTHQIRVHLHWLGFPIVGDPLYTFKRQRPPGGITHQLLHAALLAIVLPSGDKKIFTVSLPADFQLAVDELESNVKI